MTNIKLTGISLFLLFLLLHGCGDITNSPFAEQSKSTLRNSNIKSLNKIVDDQTPLRFAIIADSHQNYDDLEKVVKDINDDPDLDFVVHLGDLTNSSYSFEYDIYLSIIKDLNAPLFQVIGNHDALGYGKDLFKKHFGPWNFSFEFKGFKFVFFNNNKWEFMEENLDFPWLFEQLDNSISDKILLFNHIQPTGDCFDDNDLNNIIIAAQKPKLKIMFNGHMHTYLSSSFYTTHRQQIGRTEGQHFAKAEYNPVNNTLTLSKCDKGECVETDIVSLD